MKHLLHSLTGGDTSKYKIVSFHQTTDYTDFIGGIVSDNGKWVYKEGIFVEMCKKANEDRNNKYYIGIDEFSRGNTEAIIGELMTAIEHRDTLIKLKNGDDFLVPSNLYIVATMNITDNSTKNLDLATKERFIQYNIEPRWEIGYVEWLCSKQAVSNEVKEKLRTLAKEMAKINEFIRENIVYGDQKAVGTRAISNIPLSEENVNSAILYHILPELKEKLRNVNYTNIAESLSKIGKLVDIDDYTI